MKSRDHEATVKDRSESDAALPSRIFDYDGLAVRVAAHDAAHLDWLEEFFVPQFRVRASGPSSVSVVLSVSRPRFEELQRRGPAGSTMDAFALDSEVIQLPVWHSPDARIVLHDAVFRVFYIVSPDRTRVEILARQEHLRFRTALMRVVREYAMTHALTNSGVLLHASAVVIRGAGFLFSGVKSSGKTTLMTSLLRQPDVRYLANDRVLVALRDGAVRIRGMPAVVTVRPDMLERLPAIRDRLLSGGYVHRQTLKEMASATEPPTKAWADGRFGLTPGQYCHLLRTESVEAAEPGALVFLRISRKPGTFELRAVEPADALKRIEDSLLGARSWRKAGELFTLSGRTAPTQEELEGRCRRLVSHLPCFECVLGLQAYDDPSAARRLTEELTKRGARSP